MPIDEPDRDELLAVYLNDHLMGSSAGVDLFNRVAAGHSQPDARAELHLLAAEVTEDRNSLLVLMNELEVRPRTHRILAGRLAEKVGRLKMNGTIWKRSPLTDLVELEALRMGVEAKQAMWQALQVGLSDGRIDPSELATLVARADDQLSRLERLRRETAVRVFSR